LGLFLMNNELPPWIVERAVGGATVAAATGLLQSIAQRLRQRRPLGGWERSLPESARQRVLMDAGFGFVLGLPLLLPWLLASAASGVRLGSAWPGLAAAWVAIAVLSLRFSALLRFRSELALIGGPQRLLLEGGLLSMAVAVLGGWGLLLAILLPFLLSTAEASDRTWGPSALSADAAGNGELG
jgi:hypothetical protein